MPAGSVLEVGRATAGVRSYLAVAGGIAGGAGAGQPVDRHALRARAAAAHRRHDPADRRRHRLGVAGSGGPPSGDELLLGVRLGPRDDWFEAAELFCSAYPVSPVSNRVGAGWPAAP